MGAKASAAINEVILKGNALPPILKPKIFIKTGPIIVYRPLSKLDNIKYQIIKGIFLSAIKGNEKANVACKKNIAIYIILKFILSKNIPQIMFVQEAKIKPAIPT